MSSLLNARGNSFIMYSIATHDRKSTLTSPIISDRFNSSCHGRFLFEYYTCNYKNIRKYICICLYYFFLCFVNLIADINEKSLPRWYQHLMVLQDPVSMSRYLFSELSLEIQSYSNNSRFIQPIRLFRPF